MVFLGSDEQVTLQMLTRCKAAADRFIGEDI